MRSKKWRLVATAWRSSSADWLTVPLTITVRLLRTLCRQLQPRLRAGGRGDRNSRIHQPCLQRSNGRSQIITTGGQASRQGRIGGVAAVPTSRALFFTLDVVTKRLHAATDTVDQRAELRRRQFAIRPKTMLIPHLRYSNCFALTHPELCASAPIPDQQG